MVTRRVYERPPVIEAVALVKWAEPLDWDVTVPGLLYQHLRAGYPTKPDQRVSVQAGIELGPDNQRFQVQPGPPQMVYRNDSGDKLVLVDADGFSANGLVPYEGWDSLLNRLVTATEKIGKAVRKRGAAMREVGLRYINRWDIDGPVDLAEYLTVGLPLPEGYPQEMRGFLSRSELAYPDGASRLSMTLASIQAETPGTSSWLVDLELATTLDPPATEYLDAISSLKKRETEAFELLITDKSRALFIEKASEKASTA